MFERFNDHARRAVVLSQEEARNLNHRYIGTEHLLLGILHVGSLQALLPQVLILGSARHAVAEIIGEGSNMPTGHLPFTPRCKKVFEGSLRTTLNLDHTYIGVHHLILALVDMSLRDEEVVAGKVMRQLDVDLELLKSALTEEIKNLPRTMMPEAELVEQDPEIQEELLVKAFVRWYRRSGSQRFGPSHPVTKLYEFYTS